MKKEKTTQKYKIMLKEGDRGPEKGVYTDKKVKKIDIHYIVGYLMAGGRFMVGRYFKIIGRRDIKLGKDIVNYLGFGTISWYYGRKLMVLSFPEEKIKRFLEGYEVKPNMENYWLTGYIEGTIWLNWRWNAVYLDIKKRYFKHVLLEDKKVIAASMDKKCYILKFTRDSLMDYFVDFPPRRRCNTLKFLKLWCDGYKDFDVSVMRSVQEALKWESSWDIVRNRQFFKNSMWTWRKYSLSPKFPRNRR